MLHQSFQKKISGVPIHTWVLLGVICCIGYWPISSNLFSLKNDAYVYFLPCRYFISESIQSGHLPLWNPYFYMGFPLHGDMQSGVWNPIVILISLFGKYNMTTLQFETLLYTFLAGIGMYKLLSITAVNHRSKLIVAASYMFTGFIIDTGQITVWTGSAAFLPFVLLYYYRILFLIENVYKNALKTAITLYFLLTAGYPSFVIMCCYVLLFSLIAFGISQVRQNKLHPDVFYTLLKANALICIVFLLISLPALLSYIDYFPYYQRSSGTSLLEAQENPFNPFAVISYLFPLSVTRGHPYINTDLTARSGYIGLFTIVMLFGIFKKKLSGLQKFIVTLTIFTFLFSLGDALPVRKFCYNYIPLMNLFRHPGTMRLFTTIGLLILSCFYLDDLFAALKDKKANQYVKLSIAMIVLIGLVMIVFAKDSSFFNTIGLFKDSIVSSENMRLFLKSFYDGLSFADAILFEGVIQVCFLVVFIFLLKTKGKDKLDRIVALFILNPMLIAQFSIPSTFVTKQSPSKINGFIASSPANYPIPDLNATIANNTALETGNNRDSGFSSFYSKKLVQVKEVINPSISKNLRTFDNSAILSSVSFQNPVCYFADTVALYKDSAAIRYSGKRILFVAERNASTTLSSSSANKDEIQITQFAPWGMFFETNTTMRKPFALFQNFNKNWRLLVDGKDTEIKQGNIAFMYAEIEKGRHVLRFYYRPTYIFYSIIVSLLTVVLTAIYLIQKPKHQNKMFYA